jgi:SAM-dependent methyltransferase
LTPARRDRGGAGPVDPAGRGGYGRVPVTGLSDRPASMQRMEQPAHPGADATAEQPAQQADQADRLAEVRYTDLDPVSAARANRRWWDGEAGAYQAEHGEFLGDADFLWCPEGLRERDAGLLGPVAGRDVLEVGCGAAQCARWLAGQGARVVAFDLSAGQLAHGAALSARTGVVVPLVQADAVALPFGDARFDVACSAFGAVPFVTDSAAVMREVARVLRPGGRWVFSINHPVAWCMLDDPGPRGLTVQRSYFDRGSYVEVGASGEVLYMEQHRTVGDRLRELIAAGLRLVDLVEPEWPAGHDRVWGQWSPLRGRLFPGTAIFVAEKP